MSKFGYLNCLLSIVLNCQNGFKLNILHLYKQQATILSGNSSQFHMFDIAMTKTDLNFYSIAKRLLSPLWKRFWYRKAREFFYQATKPKSFILKQPYFYEVLLQKLTYLSTKSLQELSLP